MTVAPGLWLRELTWAEAEALQPECSVLWDAAEPPNDRSLYTLRTGYSRSTLVVAEGPACNVRRVSLPVDSARVAWIHDEASCGCMLFSDERGWRRRAG